MSAAAPPAMEPRRSAVATLPDFSDRLSPMLVKELRQGMRSPLFVWGLTVMNLFLGVVVWLTMLEPDENTLHRAFFGAYCVLVCGLLPLRAAGALHDELSANTTDTLLLTKLSGWRITMGKWLAVVAQQVLAAVTVLPYLIVRYFAGGMNVPMELAWLLIFLLLGMASAAVLTGLSWIRYFLFRAAFMMGMTYLTGKFYAVRIKQFYSYDRNFLLDDLWEHGGWHLVVLLLVPVLHLAFFCMDLGAARVGSLIENRALRRRLVALAALAVYGVLNFSADSAPAYFREEIESWSFNLGILTLAVIGLQALVEQPVNLVSVVMPWVKRGWWGRLAGRFFYQGWPSGLCFLLLLLGAAVAVAGWRLVENPEQLWEPYDRYQGEGMYRLNRIVSIGGGIIATAFAPLVLWWALLRNRLPWHFGIYGLLLGCLLAVQIGLESLALAIGNHNILKAGLPLPSMGLSWTSGKVLARVEWNSLQKEPLTTAFSWEPETTLILSGIVIQAWLVAALCCALQAFRQTTAVERQAAAGESQNDEVAGLSANAQRADRRPTTANCQLPTANCQLPTANCQLPTDD